MERWQIDHVAVEEQADVNTFVVGLAQSPLETGRSLLLQRSLKTDEQDRALGMDRYCICTSNGATHYGGVLHVALTERLLELEIDEGAIVDLDLPWRLELELRADAATVERLRTGLRRVLGPDVKIGDTSQTIAARAASSWSEDNAADAGRLLFESLPTRMQPAWAREILAAVVRRTGLSSPAIDFVERVASDPAAWPKGHDAFDAARDETLSFQHLRETRTLSPREDLMERQLLLAELVAKVTYNATDTDAPFDRDSGWWVATCLRDVLDEIGDDAFARDMWVLLSRPRLGEDRRP